MTLALSRSCWLLSLSAWISAAHASSLTVSEREVCADPGAWAVVARVAEVEPPVSTQDDFSFPWARVVHFRTEAIAHGEVEPTFTLVVASGEGPPGVFGYHSRDPKFKQGGRYLLVGGRATFRGQFAERTDMSRHFEVQLAAEGTAPSSAALAAIWSEHCDPDSDSARTLHPTAAFLEWIPLGWLSWCEHYPPDRTPTRAGSAPR